MDLGYVPGGCVVDTQADASTRAEVGILGVLGAGGAAG